MKPYDIGLTLGRFNHLHVGHEEMIETGLRLCDRLLVLVGSAQEFNTIRNPFSISTRMEMIKEVYGDRVIVKPITDMSADPENDITPDWGRFVLNVVDNYIYKMPDIMIYGNDEARSKWFDPEDIKGITEVIISRSKIKISATEIRTMLLHDDRRTWMQYTNSRLHKHYDRLRNELLAVESYKMMHKFLVDRVQSVLPDTDIDFEFAHKDDVLKYINKKYGK